MATEEANSVSPMANITENSNVVAINLLGDLSSEDENSTSENNEQKDQINGSKEASDQGQSQKKQGPEENDKKKPLEEMGLDSDKFITQPAEAADDQLDEDANEENKNKESQNTGESISILNYNPKNRVPFTEPETIQAMTETGIAYDDLFYPTKLQMSQYPKDPEIKKVVRRHHADRINRMVDIVKERRDKIIESQSQTSRETSNSSPATINRSINNQSPSSYSTMSNEDKAKRRARKDAESLLTNYFRQEKQIKEQEKREEADRERALRREKEQQRRELESRKQFEAFNRERTQLERQMAAEDERKRRELFRRDQEIAEQQRRRAEERRQQAKEFERRRRERAEQTKVHLDQMDLERNKKLRERARMMDEREAERERKLAEERKAAQQRAKAEAEKKQKRSEELRRSIQQSHNESLEALMAKEAERVAAIEEEQRARDLRASAVYTRQGIHGRSIARYEAWRDEAAAKQRELDAQIKEREERARKTAEERERERLLKRVQMKLKDEERERAARRQNALKEQQIEETRRRLSMTDRRVDEFRRERMRSNEEKKKSSERELSEISVLNDDIRNAKYGGKAVDVEGIAAKYDLDIEEIRRKVYSKPEPLSSTLPPIRPKTGTGTSSRYNPRSNSRAGSRPSYSSGNATPKIPQKTFQNTSNNETEKKSPSTPTKEDNTPPNEEIQNDSNSKMLPKLSAIAQDVVDGFEIPEK